MFFYSFKTSSKVNIGWTSKNIKNLCKNLEIQTPHDKIEEELAPHFQIEQQVSYSWRRMDDKAQSMSLESNALNFLFVGSKCLIL